MDNDIENLDENRPGQQTNFYTGISHERVNDIAPGEYPEDVDVDDLIGSLRSFGEETPQNYTMVMEDLRGHAVYRIVNREENSMHVSAMPWTDFLEATEPIGADQIDEF